MIAAVASKTLDGEINAEKICGCCISPFTSSYQRRCMNYNEPPDWFFSIRHHLGAIFIEAGKYPEAIQVYNEDLEISRENGWALKGLMNAYEKLGDKKKYDEAKIRFDEAWKHADIKISSSRIL